MLEYLGFILHYLLYGQPYMVIQVLELVNKHKLHICIKGYGRHLGGGSCHGIDAAVPDHLHEGCMQGLLHVILSTLYSPDESFQLFLSTLSRTLPLNVRATLQLSSVA
ncbi:unnamed protein product [Ascophyllum nodosum]